MAKATIPRYLRPGSIRQERIINWPRHKLRPNDTDIPASSKILAESGDRLAAESGDRIRKEQS